METAFGVQWHFNRNGVKVESKTRIPLVCCYNCKNDGNPVCNTCLTDMGLHISGSHKKINGFMYPLYMNCEYKNFVFKDDIKLIKIEEPFFEVEEFQL